MTTYSHRVELSIPEVAELLKFIAEELTTSAAQAVNWNHLLRVVLNNYDRVSEKYIFEAEDYQVDYLKCALPTANLINLAESRLTSRSSFSTKPIYTNTEKYHIWRFIDGQ